MNSRHWNEDDFLNHLYGIGPDDGHLEQCPECLGRWTELRQRRPATGVQPEISIEFLAAQRRAIYRRLDREPKRIGRFVPAFAAVAAVLIGLYFFRSHAEPPVSPISDAQLVEIYSIEQSSEPRAMKPIEALFEEN